MNEEYLLEIVLAYFKEKIFENHKVNILKNYSNLMSYKTNPIVVKYLSKILGDDFIPSTC